MEYFFKFIAMLLVLGWVGGCTSGAFLGNDNLTNGGVVTFFILVIFAHMLPDK